MKKSILVLALAGILLAQQGCKKLASLTQFNLNYDTQVTIPKTLGIDLPVNVLTPPVTTNSSSEFEVNNTSKNLIDSINLTQLRMTIPDTETLTFDFLKNIEISISADGLPDKKIAWLDDIPKTGLKTIELNVAPGDLKEYIIKDSFKLKTKTTTRELVSHDTDILIHCRFFVDAKILGL